MAFIKNPNYVYFGWLQHFKQMNFAWQYTKAQSIGISLFEYFGAKLDLENFSTLRCWK